MPLLKLVLILWTLSEGGAKKDKKYIIIPCPFDMNKYNRPMGGVDICGSLIIHASI